MQRARVFHWKNVLYMIWRQKYLNISDVDKIVREENLSWQEKYERFKWSVKVFYVFNASLIEGIEPYTIEEKRHSY